MFDAFVGGLFQTLVPMHFLLIVAGSVIGIIIGVLPGFGPVAGLALVAPFIYGGDPFEVMPFVMAIAAAGMAGGSITAVLLNIPGEAPNAATCFDGYPMTQKGEGGRAMGAALTASALGGVAGVCLAVVVIPVIIPLILVIRTADMFLLVLLGVCCIAALTGGDIIKGLVSGMGGLLLAFVGVTGTTGGVARFTFGSAYLLAGIPIIPVLLGLFAAAELVSLVVSGKTIAQAKVPVTPIRQMLEGAKDVLRNRWLWFRSTVIGYIIGALPGIGATGATFIAYGQAKQTSKHPERFGTGCVDGVIAPESANNAAYGGALLTTLSFGIPGTTSMAVVLAIFLLVGITPGPRMLIDHAELSFAMFWAIVLSNILASAFCFLLGPRMVKVTVIHPVYLLVGLTPLIVLGTFATERIMQSLVLLLVFTGVGVLMKEFGFSRPALILGLILGGLFEKYFWLALSLQGPTFILRPTSLVIIALITGLLGFNLIKSALGRSLKKGTG